MNKSSKTLQQKKFMKKFSSPNPYTSKLEREIEKLQEDIEEIKRDIDRPGDETMTSMGSTIQAPASGPIGEVIAELKAHNNARAVRKKEGFIRCHSL